MNSPAATQQQRNVNVTCQGIGRTPRTRVSVWTSRGPGGPTQASEQDQRTEAYVAIGPQAAELFSAKETAKGEKRSATQVIRKSWAKKSATHEWGKEWGKVSGEQCHP